MALPALLAAREFRGARGARAVGSHASLPARTALQAELDAHGGCVNHLCWSCDGASLLSSGDDTRLIVWDAARGVKRADVLTGHTANVFCVKPMPGTGDAVVATCAGDSQIRVHELLGSAASPRVIDSHVRRVKKLQTEAGCAHLLFSCSADSTVRMTDLRVPTTPAPHRRGSMRQAAAEALQAPDVLVAVHHGRVELHSLSIPALRPHLFAVGGNDAVTRIYDRRFLAPRGGGAPVAALLPEGVPAETAGGGVTGVAFSADGGSLLSSHLHGAVHMFHLAQPLGLTAASGHADTMGTADAAHAAPQHAPRQAPGVAAALEAAAAAAEAAGRGDLEAAREAAEEALEYVAEAEAAASMAARVARVAASRLRLARAEVLLAAAAGAGLAGGGFEARRLAQAALADAVAAAGLAPREGRAPLAAARALRVLGHVIDAREQLAVAEALGWSARLQRLRRELDRDAALARGASDDASTGSGSGTDDDDDAEMEDDADAAAATAMLELLHEAAAALRAVPPPPAPSPAAAASPGAAASVVPTRRFEGHLHAATIKDAAFLGDDEQCVASGSDGRMYIWRAASRQLLCAPLADRAVVNCVQSAPGSGLRLASCGIDTTVKLWAPTGDDEHAARAAEEARDAAAANGARRGADGGRRTMPRAVTLALLHLLRQTQFNPQDADADEA